MSTMAARPATAPQRTLLALGTESEYGWPVMAAPAPSIAVDKRSVNAPNSSVSPALWHASAHDSSFDGLYQSTESPIFARKKLSGAARRLDQHDSPASPIAIARPATGGGHRREPSTAGADHEARPHLVPSPRLRKVKLPDACEHTEAALSAGYVLGDVLATGGFSTVHRARTRDGDSEVAIKILATEAMDAEALDALANEVALWSRLRHSNVVKLHAVVEAPGLVLMVMELVEAGPLLDHINNAPDGRLDEDTARPIFRQLLWALQHCHDLGVVHGDVKPENVLLKANGEVKLGDFGFCYLVGAVDPDWLGTPDPTASSGAGAGAGAGAGDANSDSERPQFGSPSQSPEVFSLSPQLTPAIGGGSGGSGSGSGGGGVARSGGRGAAATFGGRTVSDGLALRYGRRNSETATPASLPTRALFSGTPQYAAPEVLRWCEDTGTSSDMWSAGVTLFAAVTGRLPFEEDYEPRLHQTILGGRYELPDHLSPHCRSLLSGLLNVDPRRRLTAADALAHPWFTALLRPASH